MKLQKNWNRRERYDKIGAGICMAAALLAAVVLTGWLVGQRGLLAEAYVRETQEELSKQVLRFHVRANSDSKEDQALKTRVRDELLSWMEREMPRGSGLEGTKEWLGTHLDELEDLAESVLRDAGCGDSVQAKFTREYFPEKTYGDVMFPQGTYEAFRVEIGDAKGHNWWCCLYPNLCFTDAVHAVVPREGKEKLREVLSEEEYKMITAFSNFKIRWFFFGNHEGK